MSRAVAIGAEAAPAPRGREIPRAFHSWYSPVWIVFVAYQWWLEIREQLSAALPAGVPQVHADVAAAFGALGHLAGNAVEALFYAWWWRARGARLSFARLFEWLVSISLLDLIASGASRIAEAHPGWVAHALAALSGFGALRGEQPDLSPGLRAGFGSLGLLCLARLAATAALQRQGTGGGIAAPLRLTLAVWLLCRLAIWWSVDLARGMSPLP